MLEAFGNQKRTIEPITTASGTLPTASRATDSQLLNNQSSLWNKDSET